MFTVLAILLAAAGGASAQSGPVQPQPMVGGGLVFASNGNDENALGISGSYEWPLSVDTRIRVEATRVNWLFREPVSAASAGVPEPGHVTWMTISGARVRTPQLPGSYYIGGGAGVYRATRGASQVRFGLHGYVGSELRFSDRVHVGAEIFVHLAQFDTGFNPPALGAAVRVTFAP